MSRSRALPCFVASLALACASCTSVLLEDAGGPPVDGGASDGGYDAGYGMDGGYAGLQLPDACELLNGARCQYLARCGLIDGSDAGLADCVAYHAALYCNATTWPARVLAGTLGYDAPVAQQCVDAYQGFDCSDYASEPAPCGQYLSPAVQLNGACFGPPYDECLQGVCRGAACPYRCQPPGVAGEPCELDTDCAPDAGFYCQVLGPSAGSQCAVLGGAGAPCSAGVRCAENLFCYGTTCQPLRLAGQPCVPGGCVSSAWCSAGTDGGKCSPRYDAGSLCASDDQCELGEVCLHETYTCAPAGPLPSGAACYPDQLCALGLACVGAVSAVPGQCAPPLGDGGLCLSSDDCAPSLACGPTAGGAPACGSRLADGELCALDRDCWWGSECAGGYCTRIPRPGEPCPQSTPVCWYGECSAGDGGSVCSGLASVGTPCGRDVDCASERCANACLPACGPAG